MEAARISGLCKDSDTSDIKLNFRLTNSSVVKVFPGHSAVLKCKSPVLKNMLTEDVFKEGSDGNINITIHGGMTVLCSFIRYLYTEHKPPLSFHDNVLLLKTAHFYQLTDLSKLCAVDLLNELKPTNVCSFYEIISPISEESLLTRFLLFMARCAFIIFQDELHLGLVEDQLSSLLTCDYLNVIDENQAADALWSWGSWQCLVNNKSASFTNVSIAIANMVPRIRWSLVEKNPLSDWDDLYEDGISLVPNSEQRTPTRLPSIISECNFVNFYENETAHSEKPLNLTDIKCNLLDFILRENVFLVGFEFDLYTEGENMADVLDTRIQIKLNGRLIDISGYEYSVMDVMKENEKQYLFNRYIVELEKPIVLNKERLHSFILEKTCSAEKVSYPKYNLKSYFAPESEKDRFAAQFIVVHQISSMVKLYYHPRYGF